MEELLSKRKAYVTPEEILKILQATQNNASQGYDATTLNYLTGQTDRAFSSAQGAAVRLGANPNDLSALFDQKLMQVMKIGSDNHAENMKNFSTYLGAMGVVAENKAAEQISAENILKDKIQAKAGEIRTDSQNVGNAINSGIGALASSQTASLYKDRTNAISATGSEATSGAKVSSSGYTSAQWEELASILNYSGDKSWNQNALK